MKLKLFTLFICLNVVTYVFSQGGTNFDKTGGGLFGGDVIINNQAGIDERNAVVASAFNGWLYSAFTTVNTGTDQGGITISRSKDNGFTWQVIDSYSVTGVRYMDVEIEVVGPDTNNLQVYVAAVRQDVGTGSFLVFLDEYNGATGTFTGSNFNQSNGTNLYL